MPLFVCEKCGCVENTALGFYWSRNRVKCKDESLNGKALCSECAPQYYEDGSKSDFDGQWHGKFEKMLYDSKTDDVLNKPVKVKQR